jgi:hypothetical protein
MLPLLQDMTAHVFWKAEHIATVHHHYGNHHANEEINAAAQEKDNERIPKAAKIVDPVSVHITVQNVFVHPCRSMNEREYSPDFCYRIGPSLEKNFPPPRFT